MESFSEAVRFVKGNGEIDIAELEKQMQNASEALDFELAAKLTWPHRVNNVVNLDGYYRRIAASRP